MPAGERALFLFFSCRTRGACKIIAFVSRSLCLVLMANTVRHMHRYQQEQEGARKTSPS